MRVHLDLNLGPEGDHRPVCHWSRGHYGKCARGGNVEENERALLIDGLVCVTQNMLFTVILLTTWGRELEAFFCFSYVLWHCIKNFLYIWLSVDYSVPSYQAFGYVGRTLSPVQVQGSYWYRSGPRISLSTSSNAQRLLLKDCFACFVKNSMTNLYLRTPFNSVTISRPNNRK